MLVRHGGDDRHWLAVELVGVTIRTVSNGMTPNPQNQENAKKRGKNNRVRGQNGEREIVQLVRDDLGLELKGRRLGQERDGGHDVDIGPLRAQVKRRKAVAGLYEFLDGADVLAIRADGERWLMVMDWPMFVRLAREEIRK